MSMKPKYRGHLKVYSGEGRRDEQDDDLDSYLRVLFECIEEWGRRGPAIVAHLRSRGAIEAAVAVAVAAPALEAAAAQIRRSSVSQDLPA